VQAVAGLLQGYQTSICSAEEVQVITGVLKVMREQSSGRGVQAVAGLLQGYQTPVCSAEEVQVIVKSSAGGIMSVVANRQEGLKEGNK
jgi:hypothetical protein